MEQPAERRRNGRPNAVPADRDVERLLVWVYQVQRAHLADRGMGRELGWLGCVAQDYEAIGQRVDGGSGTAFALAAEAEAIHDAVLRLRYPALGLVVVHARSASRPDWGEGLRPRVVPLLDQAERRGGRAPCHMLADADGPNCAISYVDYPDHLVALRRDYSAWWAGLCEVARAVSGRIPITGPSAPRTPWVAPGA